MQMTITISDADRSVDYILAVSCDFLCGSAPRLGWLDGGEPGAAPQVEIGRIRCLEMALWCGPYAVSAFPGSDLRESLEQRIGEWCLHKYAAEIEAAVLETCLVRRSTDTDSD
jgi:hypothetical protein